MLRLDELTAALLPRLPVPNPPERRVGLEVYRQLARGEPVRPAAIGEALSMSEASVRAALDGSNLKGLTYADDTGNIIGFGGLAIRRMSHRMTLDGRTLYAWCAWDSLFIPIILGRSAEVESHGPNGSPPVRLHVAPDGVSRVEPDGSVMSFLLPSADAFQADVLKAMASFCHFVFFFPSAALAAEWSAGHAGTMTLTMSDAFELGRRMVASRWLPELGRPTLNQ